MRVVNLRICLIEGMDELLRQSARFLERKASGSITNILSGKDTLFHCQLDMGNLLYNLNNAEFNSAGL